MPVTTTSAAVHITPVVLKTFVRHTKHKTLKAKHGDESPRALDDIYYDEAFHIVKAFIELGTKNTAESLQRFTNTHVPAPFWVAVVPVRIPLASSNRAADALIEWFGSEDLKRVVGGERWWQVRGLDWLDAEWITEKDFLKDIPVPDDVNRTEEENTIKRMEQLDRVMLYVHGGAFYWGSINTHRYQVIRYAKKIKGRAFAVNYRKAPQYPWPCPLQDVLAAYFYLTRPPSGAAHKAVQPSKLVFAGDSAGAALCLSALTVLRDLGLPQPAGAVLISPWVDLTHSFPSVMTNTATDIIPPHGFIHKPSTLWPVHPKPEGGYTRVVPTKTKPPPQPGHASKLKPDTSEAKSQVNERLLQSTERGGSVPHASELEDNPSEVLAQKDMQAENGDEVSKNGSASLADGSLSNGDQPKHVEDGTDAGSASSDIALEFYEPKPPKVLMEDPNAIPWELRAQIQLYATTEQLSHPLVSPIMQSSLGNLCPLYIIAGDGERLRDEIIYLAHKAAHPKDYPVRQGVLQEGRRQKENADKFQTPTKVHLQVFDDLCHVLTVFTFTTPGKYAYRSIAQFVKHVIDNPGGQLQHYAFPEVSKDHTSDRERATEEPEDRSHLEPRSEISSPSSGQTGVNLYESNVATTKEEVEYGKAEKTSGQESPGSGGSKEDDPVLFIRERVNPLGHVRPMEPAEEVPALRLKPSEIGIIKEKPVRMWLEGQDEWDRRYKSQAEAVIRKRKHYQAKWEKLLEHAKQEGLFGEKDSLRSTTSAVSTGGTIETDRRWGPLDLEGERPPPSAIAGRNDTREAVALLKKAIYHSAPVTHHQVPKQKVSGMIRAAFDPHDMAIKPPPQSVAEQQVHSRLVPMHGLRMWQTLVELFMRKSRQKVANGGKHAKATLRSAKDSVPTVTDNASDQS
ncbi:alpha/beta-hydrolase [Dichomitus squalens]|uniref:Alpha/beta-hydrolase n=1 Tax=Dichomitus squalens TaxID=114155 RepID=A0A4Q9M8R5_9APHY|nr:alpha/beta-hydrolase [Dichomitus squalens]